MEEHVCGTCKWHHCDKFTDWVCTNPDSDYYTDWTEYKETCDEWEGR